MAGQLEAGLPSEHSLNWQTCNDSQTRDYENSCFLLLVTKFGGGLLHSFIVTIAN